MKRLLTILMLTALSAVAQTNTPTAPPTEAEARAAYEKKVADIHAQFAEATRQLNEAMERAQARAVEREAMRATGWVAPTNEVVVKVRPPRPKPYYNTNAMPEGFGLLLQAVEKHHPGISTNFTPAQRALTNYTRITPAQVSTNR